ncbi:MAG: hypothetical protein V3T48_10015, partial [Vicinamibacterales bacterium]
MIKSTQLDDGTYHDSGFGTKATLKLEHPLYGSAIVDITLPQTPLVSVDVLWANRKVSANVSAATAGRMALVDAGVKVGSGGPGVTCPGVGCQLPDQLGHGAGGILAATSDLNPNFGFRVADTMLPTAGGVVSNVCWWGSYFNFDLGTSCFSVNDDFSVSYYQDDAGGGIPGTLIAGPLPVILTGKFATGNMLLGFIPEYQYEAFHAPVLLGNDRVWIEIVNDTSGADCGWLWSTAAPGDGRGAHDGPAPNGTYDVGEGADFDMAYGVDIPIESAGPPSNDLCADAIGPLAVPSVESGTTSGATNDNVGFCGTSNTAPGVWYTVIGTGNTMTATTCENQSFPGSADYDTKISVFSGSCASLTCVAGNDDESGCNFHSTVMWGSAVGVEYRILVHGFSSATGNFNLAVSDVSGPPNDSCEDAIGPLLVPSVVSGTTSGATNDNVGFCGTSNTAPGVWYTVIGTGNTMTATTCENQSFPGSADYDTKISVFSGPCANLTCVAGNDDESGCSFHSTVTWCSAVGVEYRILVHGFSSATGNFDLAVSDNGVPCGPAPNDLCEDAIGPLAVPSVESGTTIDATFDDVGFCGTSNTAPGVWYTVIGTGTTMTATTCENQSFPGSADYDTKISVFCGDCPTVPASNCCTNHGGLGCDDSDCQDTVCAVDPFCCATAWDSICTGEAADLCGDLCATGAICVAGNDDEPGCSFHSTVTWCSQAGAEYRILVHGFGLATGNFELAISDDGVGCTATVKCLPEGACCFFDGSCALSTEGDCLTLGGNYQGDDTACFNVTGNPTVTVTNPNLAIPDNDPVGVSDTIDILDDFIIGDVDVDLVIDHTWIGDLVISIEHNGQVVTLWDRACFSQNDIDVIFDDEGGALICAQPTVGNIDPLTSGTGPLSTFDGQSSAGTWTITVSDNEG